MKPSFHLAAPMPSRKRDAGLRACEWHGAPQLRCMWNYGIDIID